MTSRKPVIGLTTSCMPNPYRRPAFGVNVPYSLAISAAGGLPVLIPLNLPDDDLDELLLGLDGILFTGGGDIDPLQYESQPHPKLEGLDAERDRLEIHLVKSLLGRGKPFFGICRGCQVINVAFGGSLYEDLPDQFQGSVLHDRHDRPRNYLAHNVKLDPASQLAQFIGDDALRVNSLHHQGVRRLAQSLIPTALAPDGLVEAFELPSYPFGLAVQWHPEELQEYKPMRSLFEAFIQVCVRGKSHPVKKDTP